MADDCTVLVIYAIAERHGEVKPGVPALVLRDGLPYHGNVGIGIGPTAS
jgi:hypothetical protein